MNNIFGITVENLMDHLPVALAEDKSKAALARGFSEVLAARPAEIDEASIYARIDKLPEALLDILAYDFKIDWYDYDYPIEAKRNLVKSNYYVHRHLGTVGAVRAAIQAIYPNSDVEEWWQDFYDGEPYHFRVMLESSSPIIPISNTDILRAIYLYKSMRSHLDGVIYHTTTNILVGLSVGWIVYGGRKCGTYPRLARNGAIEDSDIVVETSKGGIAYQTPAAGEISSGTYPEPAQMGAIDGNKIVVETAKGGVAYRNPATGEIVSGVFPKISQMGGTGDGSISTTSTGNGVAYQGKTCGDVLNFIKH